MNPNTGWGMLYVSAPSSSKCTCGCAACTNPEHPTKCPCCSGPDPEDRCCEDCICTGYLAGFGTPDAYTILNYDFY